MNQPMISTALLIGSLPIMRNNTYKVVVTVLLTLLIGSAIALPITVNVVGYVRQPGVVIMDNNNRITDVIFMANRLPSEARLPNEAEKQTNYSEEMVLSFDDLPVKMSLRRVTLLRNGEERVLDLMKYFRLGETEQNPYLLDGDVISVTCIMSEVFLNGGWNQNQKLELLDGDRLSLIANLGLGLQPVADLNRIFIYRFTDDYLATETIKIDFESAMASPGSEADIKLQNGDDIYVYRRPFFNGKEFVKVEGKVKYPGQYPINNGELSLLELLELCGGPSERGDLKLAYIVDPEIKLQSDPDYRRLRGMSKREMSFAEYGYFILRLREMKGKYSVDMNKLWESKDSAYDVKLKPGAYIYIPEKLDKVIVSGHVVNPGLYEFEEGLTWKEWIEEAGGKLDQSKLSHSRIVDARTGQWKKPKKDDVLKPGDMIFVPQAKDRSLWEDTQTVIAFTSQVITIFLGITSLTR